MAVSVSEDLIIAFHIRAVYGHVSSVQALPTGWLHYASRGVPQRSNATMVLTYLDPHVGNLKPWEAIEECKVKRAFYSVAKLSPGLSRLGL